MRGPFENAMRLIASKRNPPGKTKVTRPQNTHSIHFTIRSKQLHAVNDSLDSSFQLEPKTQNTTKQQYEPTTPQRHILPNPIPRQSYHAPLHDAPLYLLANPPPNHPVGPLSPFPTFPLHKFSPAPTSFSSSPLTTYFFPPFFPSFPLPPAPKNPATAGYFGSPALGLGAGFGRLIYGLGCCPPELTASTAIVSHQIHFIPSTSQHPLGEPQTETRYRSPQKERNKNKAALLIPFAAV